MDSDGLAAFLSPAEFFAKLVRLPDVEGLDIAEQQLLALELFRASLPYARQLVPKEQSIVVDGDQQAADWRSAAAAILPSLQHFVQDHLANLLDRGRTEIDLRAKVSVKVEGDMIRQEVEGDWLQALGDPERWESFAQYLFTKTIASDRPLVYRRCAECHGIMHTGADGRRRFCGEGCALKHRRAVSAEINRRRRREQREKQARKSSKRERHA
jgi:hypothetical protein